MATHTTHSGRLCDRRESRDQPCPKLVLSHRESNCRAGGAGSDRSASRGSGHAELPHRSSAKARPKPESASRSARMGNCELLSMNTPLKGGRPRPCFRRPLAESQRRDLNKTKRLRLKRKPLKLRSSPHELRVETRKNNFNANDPQLRLADDKSKTKSDRRAVAPSARARAKHNDQCRRSKAKNTCLKAHVAVLLRQHTAVIK
jgi:hypothetical protein